MYVPMYILCLKCACVFVFPQRTGWSALYFSAERGDVDTTTSLLKAEANAQLRDKVCYLSFISPSFLLSVLFTCLHLISIKNGLTPLEVAIVKRDEWKEETEKRQRRYKCDYKGVIDLLSRYSKEPAILASHDVSRFNTHNNHVAFIILPHIVQDTPSPEQDTTPTHLSSTVDKDTLSSPTNSQVSSVLCKRFIHYLHYYY